MSICLMRRRTFSHSHIRDLDRQHSQIPFQHIPRASQILPLFYQTLHKRSELSAEESAIVSTNISMNLKQLWLSWDMIHFKAPWQDPSWPVKRGRSSTEKGFFSEPDKENLLQEFCATLTVKNILARYFHQGVQSLCKIRGGDIVKNTGSQVKCELSQGCSRNQLLCQTHFLNDGNVLMENRALGLLRSNQVK